jgi:hypothetical protein
MMKREKRPRKQLWGRPRKRLRKRLKKRGPLDPITVGSKLTKRTRQPSIYDDSYHDRVLRGEYIDSRVKLTPVESLDDFRFEVEKFCRDEFKKVGLGDPFRLIDRKRQLPPLESKKVFAMGLDYLKEQFALGYDLAAFVDSPGEDQSPLWYASQLVIWLTRLDLFLAQLRAEAEPPEALITFAAHTGVQLGRLMEESKFKEKYEAFAMSSMGSTAALKKSRANIDRADVAEEWHAEARAAADRIRRRSPHLKTKSAIAPHVIRELQANDPTFNKSVRTVRSVI